MNRRFLPILVLMGSLCGTSAWAQANPAGTWAGDHDCAQGDTGITLVISPVHQDGSFDGLFTFYNLPGHANAASGAYTVTGHFDRAHLQLVALPGNWVNQPFGYVMVGFHATLNQAGDDMTGMIDLSDCSQINLHRREPKPSQGEPLT